MSDVDDMIPDTAADMVRLSYELTDSIVSYTNGDTMQALAMCASFFANTVEHIMLVSRNHRNELK